MALLIGFDSRGWVSWIHYETFGRPFAHFISPNNSSLINPRTCTQVISLLSGMYFYFTPRYSMRCTWGSLPLMFVVLRIVLEALFPTIHAPIAHPAVVVWWVTNLVFFLLLLFLTINHTSKAKEQRTQRWRAISACWSRNVQAGLHG